ncbi:hypothetical protein [Gloeobacter kilaueensis]|uniref:Uncharacterized protein n=1 Tax=Gloeobacter kilaueensis (strain ATCC BAA-2537 / CCAP 1431/1 / ULC 316 / JS1) TaxID=1183438 RepID=U5QK44_GLOK1|nr:hypothetical protein [Gloeobacter kilaueensis]AGY58045.1 hypothetical protein GKIL_1799 [Gloeobacter kilaueensis JS1]
MSDPVRYVTNQEGERVGVLLDLESYRHLQNQQQSRRDSEELQGLSDEELRALTMAWLAPDAQAQLDNLLARNAEGDLPPEETTRLDELLARVDQLALLVARARLTLRKSKSAFNALVSVVDAGPKEIQDNLEPDSPRTVRNNAENQ